MATASHTPTVAELLDRRDVHFNLAAAPLVEHAIRKGEGKLAANGAIVATTGKKTGRSPKDKFIVKDALTANKVACGAVNQPFDANKFDALYARVMEYLDDRELFVQDLFCGADTTYRLPVRFVNEYAWHNLFVRQLFIRPSGEELRNHKPEFTVIAAPDFKADPLRDGTASEAFVILNFTERVVLIGGGAYAGEMKKSIFSIMNFLMPPRNVFPMHCSSNVGHDGVTALFFGLSGTGKTTLSADPSRALIGDDEHGWSSQGVFNFEGGCYAKCIKLSKEGEPQIWNAIRFGSVLENTVINPETRVPDYDTSKLTENTRVTYPVDFIDGAVIPSMGGHPKNVIFLTADAYGVMPPVSKLTSEQAMYYFINGYTSKLAGTESGVTEPQPNFSPCFGGVFLPRPPITYAKQLADKIAKHKANVWLLNTGWTGGPYGTGSRFKLAYTRAMVAAIYSGALANAKYTPDEVFGLPLPDAVPGVPNDVLHPKNTWKDKAAYDTQAKKLAKLFRENDATFDMPDAVRKAGPR